MLGVTFLLQPHPRIIQQKIFLKSADLCRTDKTLLEKQWAGDMTQPAAKSPCLNAFVFLSARGVQ
jgi:hypothetical protein